MNLPPPSHASLGVFREAGNRIVRHAGHRFTTLVLWAFMSAGLMSTGRAAIYDYAVPGDYWNRAMRLNVADTRPTVRGILIYCNWAGGDNRDLATDPELVALADVLGFALVATSQWGNFSDPQELPLFEASLQTLSSMSGHAELINAPWLPFGISNGGQMSYGLNALRPEKVIAYAVNKGGTYLTARPWWDTALLTPGLLIAGEADTEHRRTAIADLFFGNRPRGALAVWVEEQGIGHAEGDSEELIRPFAEAMVYARYPTGASPLTGPVQLLSLNESAGWLTEPNSYKNGLAEIAPFDGYTKDIIAAGWLPNRRIAYLFRAMASYDKATATATLSSGSGPVASGTAVTYTISKPVAPWTAIEFYEGDVLLKRSTPADIGNLAVQAAPTTPGYAVYHALVTFADGTRATTAPRRVLIRMLPTQITGQPQNQTTTEGAGVNFTMTVEGNPAPTFQWQRLANGTANWTNLAEGGSYSGVTKTTLTINTPTLAMSNDQFRCLVLSSSSSITSSAAILTVGKAPTVVVPPVSAPSSGGGGVSWYFLVVLALLAAIRKFWVKQRAFPTLT